MEQAIELQVWTVVWFFSFGFAEGLSQKEESSASLVAAVHGVVRLGHSCSSIFCFTLFIMSAPEGQEPAVDPQPTGRSSMGKKEAMEQFARIFEILNGLTGQTNQTSQSQGAPSAAAGVAGSLGSMGEKSIQSTLPSITTQEGSSQSAIAPTFLQVVQQPPLISAPAQNLSAPGGAPICQPWQLGRAQQICCKPKKQCQLCRCRLPCLRSQAT